MVAQEQVIKTDLTESLEKGDISGDSSLDINTILPPASPYGDSDPGMTDGVPGEIEYNSIMDACSTAALQLRQTITEVLNSRADGQSSPSKEDTSSILEVSVQEKLADFENTVKGSLSPSCVQQQLENVPSQDSSGSAPCLEQANLVETPLISSDAPIVSCASPSVLHEIEKDSSPEALCTDKTQNAASSCKVNNGSSIDDIIEEKVQKKSKNSSNKKKGEKTVDQILKSLSGYASSEDKLQILCKRHSDTLEDLRTSEAKQKQSERLVIQLAREKEQLQAEHNRMVLAKSRLESLCRELQRQNKAVKEESLLRIREEEEKRKEVASKFQTTLNEISSLMQENSKKNLQLKEENAELAQKLKTLVEHYEMWEKHMEKVVHQKDLETQLAKAKHTKLSIQLKQETEKYLREKQGLLENMSELQKKCTQLASNELQLRAELGDYTSKYEEFQTVLNKSNQVFATFKTDMETTSKKIKKLEKETNIWKQKWEGSNNALLEMITDKQKRDKELVNAHQRILMLEKLCRALQAERNDLQSQVNGVQNNESATPSE